MLPQRSKRPACPSPPFPGAVAWPVAARISHPKPPPACVCALAGQRQDKTRANAAGALGNLVRNSSTLCGELIRAGALKVG